MPLDFGPACLVSAVFVSLGRASADAAEPPFAGASTVPTRCPDSSGTTGNSAVMSVAARACWAGVPEGTAFFAGAFAASFSLPSSPRSSSR